MPPIVLHDSNPGEIVLTDHILMVSRTFDPAFDRSHIGLAIAFIIGNIFRCIAIGDSTPNSGYSLLKTIGLRLPYLPFLGYALWLGH